MSKIQLNEDEMRVIQMALNEFIIAMDVQKKECAAMLNEEALTMILEMELAAKSGLEKIDKVVGPFTLPKDEQITQEDIEKFTKRYKG